MKNTELKIPALRFSGFEGEWEEKRLDRVTTINPKTIDIPDKFIYIDLESVEKGILVKKNAISLIEAPSRAQRILQKDDIIFQTVRPYQKNNFYFTLKDATYVASTGYAQLRTQECPYFLYCYLHTEKFVNNVLVRCTGTSYPAINSSDLSSIKIKIPSFAEQQKIADFLSAVDKRLQLLKEKKTKLEEYKRGVMQRIFSQELRFTRPDGSAYPDWEEKRLGEVCVKKSSNLSQNELEFNNGNFKVYGASGFLKHIDFYLEENPYIGIVKDGAGVGRLFLCDKQSSVLGTLDVLVNKKNTDIIFLYYILNLINFEKYSIGSTIPHIYFKDYSKEKLHFPSLSEQRQIADFLSAIDDKISLLSKQIQSTEQYKKGLLQQMFV